jgi:hypothetical protein
MELKQKGRSNDCRKICTWLIKSGIHRGRRVFTLTPKRSIPFGRDNTSVKEWDDASLEPGDEWLKRYRLSGSLGAFGNWVPESYGIMELHRMILNIRCGNLQYGRERTVPWEITFDYAGKRYTRQQNSEKKTVLDRLILLVGCAWAIATL